MITTWNELPFFLEEAGVLVINKIAEERGVENNDAIIIYPQPENIYKALDWVLNPEQTSVVILGQDPYPTPGHAHGLAFSVKPNVSPLPRSLQNIFKELKDDLRLSEPSQGDLTSWAQQGVLLLNTCLTVDAFKPGSHIGYGWERLAKEVISEISTTTEHRVFILWGRHAQSYEQFIDTSKHLVLKSPHPSPLSAHYGFFGSKPFSKTNEYLISHSLTPIDWDLTHVFEPIGLPQSPDPGP